MPRTIEKPEALSLLERNRRELLGDSDGCVMCALVRRASETSDFWAESEHGLVILDRFGSRIGHALVLAREHREDTADLGWPLYSELQRLAYDTSVALKTALSPLRIFVAVLGASAQVPMSFPHFHIHVLPVYESDERARPANVFSWSAGVLVYEDDEARELGRRVKAAWPRRPEPAEGGA